MKRRTLPWDDNQPEMGARPVFAAPGTPADQPGGEKPWSDEDDEREDPLDRPIERKPARFFAPPGECLFCDRRRAAARVSMRSSRERGSG